MRLLLALLLSLACTANAQEPPAWFSESLLDLREDVAEAGAQDKRVMLYFGQDGCPYCKRLMEVNFRQASTAAKAAKSVVALALNIWGDREVTWTNGARTTEKRLAATLKVQFTPTILFLDEGGEIALRLNGYLPPHHFDLALDYVAEKKEKQLPFGEYLKARAGDAASEKLNPQAFFMTPPYNLRRERGAKPLAVLFETTSCAQCDELHAVAFRRPEVLAQLARFDVARFSLSEAAAVAIPGSKRTLAAAHWAQELGVGYVPTMVLFDARGQEVMRIEAYLRPFHIAAALEYVSSGAYRREPSFQRFLQAKAERMRGRGERVELWE